MGISIIQGFGLAALLESQPGLVLFPGWSFRLTTVLITTVGSMFVMWLGEQINAYGIGNGSSIIIFAGIVANLPAAVIKVINLVQLGQTDPLTAVLLVIIVLVVLTCVVFLERGERRVPVQYARRVVGNKVYGGQSSYIPLKINPSGVIPVIFAGSLIQMPILIFKGLGSKFAFFNTVAELFAGGPVYFALMAALIIFFSFFYTAIIFNPVELADNIRKSGGFIPGIRPGKKTSEFFDYLLTRVGLPGAIYLALLAILPGILRSIIAFPVMFSGISLLIVIGVALDISAQIESHLIERRYEGFLSSGRVRGRRYGR